MKIFCKNLLFYLFVHQFLLNLSVSTKEKKIENKFSMQMVDTELKNSFYEFEDTKKGGEKIDRLGFVYKLSDAYAVLSNRKREKGLKKILEEINELKLNSSNGEKFEIYKEIYEKYFGKTEDVGEENEVKVGFGDLCNIAELISKRKLKKLHKYIKKLEKEYNFKQILNAEEKCEEVENYFSEGKELKEDKLEKFCEYFKQKREEILKV